MYVKWSLLMLIRGFLILILLLLLLMQGRVNAADVCRLEKTRVVAISGDPGEKGWAEVKPREMKIAPGTCVVWVNWAEGPQISVVFQEGKVCHDVTRAPTGFSLNNQRCYVSSFLPQGGTSSLKFTKEGTFNYEVVFGGGRAVKCKLIVQKQEN